MKKIILLICILLISKPSICQDILFPNTNFDMTPDTIVFSGVSHPVFLHHIDYNEDLIYYYPFTDRNNLRSVPISSQVNITSDNSDNRGWILMDVNQMLGKTIYAKVIPGKSGSDKWRAVFDTGFEQTKVLTTDGVILQFPSEMSIINWLILNDWEVEEIQILEKVDIDFAALLFGSTAAGGSVKISKTVYIMKKQL